jgi:hypothetical protein
MRSRFRDLVAAWLGAAAKQRPVKTSAKRAKTEIGAMIVFCSVIQEQV